MSGNKKYTFRKILVITVWILLGSGTVVLLVAAITKKNDEQIAGVEINISGVQNNYFIDKNEVTKILELTNGKSLENATIGSLDLASMENALQKDQWIKNAELFFDNNNVLQVKIKEREPIARIFTTMGTTFYMDSSLTRLPLSNKFSASLPVFTDFPTDVAVLTKKDSILLNGIKILSEFIGNNPFWMAQIDQIDITPTNTFELIPKLGNQVICFGSANNYEEKFNKLLAFYKQVETRTGWNRYSIIDLQFKNEIVGVNRNAQEIKMDSLRTIAIMKNIIADAQKNTDDSTHIQLTQPEDDNSKVNSSPIIENIPNEDSIENKMNAEKSKVNGSVTPIHDREKPLFKNPQPVNVKSLISRPASNEKPNPGRAKKTDVKKEGLKKPKEKIKQQPKAVMPPKSDY